MGKFNWRASMNIRYLFCDFFFTIVAFLISASRNQIFEEESIIPFVGIGIAFVTIYFLSGLSLGIYNSTTFFYPDRFIKRSSLSVFIAVTIFGLLLVFPDSQLNEYHFVAWYLILSYFFLLGSGFLEHYVLRKIFTKHQRAVIIGSVSCYEKFIDFLNRSNEEFELIGFVSYKEPECEGYLGHVDQLEDLVHKHAVDHIYIMSRVEKYTDIQEIVNTCIDMGITVHVIENKYNVDEAHRYVSSVGTYPVVVYHTVSLNKPELLFKRLVDIGGALFGIILFSPIMLIAAIAIRLESKGPVIFKQKRVGLNGRHFNMYKFRSMCLDAEAKKKDLMTQNEMKDQFMFKMKDDPRITKVGKFIRKTSIDELPQFFNVLLGDMSLVGTRPPTLDEVTHYKRNHWRRMSIKPGVTGMWQISGRSSITDFDEIVALDTMYIDEWNVLTDFKIILKTAISLLGRKGAF